MKINEQILIKLLKDKNINDLQVLFLEQMNIAKISLNLSQFESIQFLSLKNNNLINLNFIKAFPNLFYLDVRGNHVNKNIFIIF